MNHAPQRGVDLGPSHLALALPLAGEPTAGSKGEAGEEHGDGDEGHRECASVRTQGAAQRRCSTENRSVRGRPTCYDRQAEVTPTPTRCRQMVVSMPDCSISLSASNEPPG